MAEAHAALGYVKHFNWDWAGAEREFKLAIELKPNLAYAHDRYGSFLISRGRTEEAIAESNRAQELDPFSFAISAQRGFILENARRYDEAIEQLQEVIAMDRDNGKTYGSLVIPAAAGGFPKPSRHLKKPPSYRGRPERSDFWECAMALPGGKRTPTRY
jgi:tetratricopeptide (TPR) repeat protein